MTSLALPAPKRASILPHLGVAVVAAAILGPGAAFAGTDTSFNTALTQFTNFLSGSGGKVITVLSLAGGIVGLASGRFSLAQVAVPVGTGVAAGTGVPIVTAMVTATI
jgi:conjugal transfer pilus assembly protein TraA